MKRSIKHYAIERNSSKKATLVCFSLDATRPDAYMESVEKDLLDMKYRGEVLLDLLVTNGESSRRFIRMTFDGEKLHWLTAKIAPLSSIDSDTQHFCQMFYAAHPSALSKSILSLY